MCLGKAHVPDDAINAVPPSWQLKPACERCPGRQHTNYTDKLVEPCHYRGPHPSPPRVRCADSSDHHHRHHHFFSSPSDSLFGIIFAHLKSFSRSIPIATVVSSSPLLEIVHFLQRPGCTVLRAVSRNTYCLLLPRFIIELTSYLIYSGWRASAVYFCEFL